MRHLIQFPQELPPTLQGLGSHHQSPVVGTPSHSKRRYCTMVPKRQPSRGIVPSIHKPSSHIPTPLPTDRIQLDSTKHYLHATIPFSPAAF